MPDHRDTHDPVQTAPNQRANALPLCPGNQNGRHSGHRIDIQNVDFAPGIQADPPISGLSQDIERPHQVRHPAKGEKLHRPGRRLHKRRREIRCPVPRQQQPTKARGLGRPCNRTDIAWIGDIIEGEQEAGPALEQRREPGRGRCLALHDHALVHNPAAQIIEHGRRNYLGRDPGTAEQAGELSLGRRL